MRQTVYSGIIPVVGYTAGIISGVDPLLAIMSILGVFMFLRTSNQHNLFGSGKLLWSIISLLMGYFFGLYFINSDLGWLASLLGASSGLYFVVLFTKFAKGEDVPDWVQDILNLILRKK